MRRLTFILLFVFLAGCNFEPESKSITVKIQSSGEVEVKPDIAEFAITVNCINKNIKASSACVKKKLDEVIEVLLKFKINKGDYHSSGISLNKEYYWKNNTQVFKGYSSSVSTMIVVRDIEKLNNLLGTLMNHKHLSLNGLSYSHSEIDKLKHDAYINALENAKFLAQRLQTELEGNSLEIVEIINSNEPFSASSPQVKLFERKSNVSQDESININVGTLVLRKNLKVQFRIKK